MGSRSRIRTRVDQGRLAMLAAAPGIDTRTWVCIARVDDDEDAIRFAMADDEAGPLGWLVDVTIQGGPLDQEPIDGCRVASYFGGNDTGKIDPIGQGCLVVVVLPAGGTNEEPTIVGVLDDITCPPPPSVNGTDIDEAYALATHILVTDKAVDEEVAGDIRVATPNGTHRLLGNLVELASEDAEQSFVRGDEHIEDVNSLRNALQNFGANLAASTPAAPNGALTVADVAAAVTTLTNDLAAIDFSRALSTRIKGE